MISYITWVSNKEQYDVFKKSLDVCGDIQREFIEVGQEVNSMAKAYNKGSKLATGNIFVYCHQDVRIKDKDFEIKLEHIFKEFPDTGFVGPIGNVKINIGSWWTVGPSFCRGRVIQGGGNNFLSFGEYNGHANQLDGLMMCTDKNFTFPEELPGIHFLDLWMCRVAELSGYKNRIFNTVVQHLSGGENTSDSHRNNWNQYKNKFFTNI